MTPRQLTLLEGEVKLRAHLPEDVALRTHLYYRDACESWTIVVSIWPPNGASMIELGEEPLEEFPSDTMIAQAVLVA